MSEADELRREELRRALATLRKLVAELTADAEAAGLTPAERSAAEAALAKARTLAAELEQVLRDDPEQRPD